MEGIINVLKPPGMTSHDVVSYARRLFGVKRIGHGGTLDPAAAGVLPLFVGKATKAVEFFEGDDKEYIAEMIFGITTDTGDSQGRILEIRDAKVDISTLKDIFKAFMGVIEQLPPMYSAVHYKGKRLYELARQGITVEREPRRVEIKNLKLINFDNNTALIKVVCSKGTYIRTLCEDMGKKASCGACLGTLIRTRTGNFQISCSHTLEEMAQYSRDNIEALLIPVDEALDHLPATNISLENPSFFGKGRVFSYMDKLPAQTGDLVRVYSGKDFLGIAKVTHINQSLQVVKSFMRVDV